MVFGYYREFNYYVVLKHEIDYFDYVPNIEKEARMRSLLFMIGFDKKYDTVEEYSYYASKKMCILISSLKSWEKDERLIESEFYKLSKNNLHKNECETIKLNYDFGLNHDERRLLQIVKEKLGDIVLEEGWYDYTYIN